MPYVKKSDMVSAPDTYVSPVADDLTSAFEEALARHQKKLDSAIEDIASIRFKMAVTVPSASSSAGRLSDTLNEHDFSGLKMAIKNGLVYVSWPVNEGGYYSPTGSKRVWQCYGQDAIIEAKPRDPNNVPDFIA